MMDETRDPISRKRAGQASAMLLSLLFSLWIAVGGVAGGLGPSTPEIERAAPAKAVVVQAGAGKQAQQPRTPDPTPALPPAVVPVLAEERLHPAGIVVSALLAPLGSALVSPYQARAPPAR